MLSLMIGFQANVILAKRKRTRVSMIIRGRIFFEVVMWKWIIGGQKGLVEGTGITFNVQNISYLFLDLKHN